MTDGIIEIDSPKAKKLGFTSDKFSDFSYLWEDGDNLIVSCISTPELEEHTGAFREFMKKALTKYLNVIIPTPLPRMVEIGEKQGWPLYRVKIDNESPLCYVIRGRVH